MIWTDDIIKTLINCPKKVIDPPREINKGTRMGFIKKTFTLESMEGQYLFSGFIAQNSTFLENFSIGLVYDPREEKGSTVLVRCNGKHGGTKENPHHAFFHVHSATAERINAGLRPEGHIEVTDAYSTLDSALEYFVNLVKIIPSERHNFLPPKNQQIDLFDNEY
jgi:hypothetical protein